MKNIQTELYWKCLKSLEEKWNDISERCTNRPHMIDGTDLREIADAKEELEIIVSPYNDLGVLNNDQYPSLSEPEDQEDLESLLADLEHWFRYHGQ